MVELNLTGKLSDAQDASTEVAREIEAYGHEVIHDILTGNITAGDAIAEIDAGTDEAITALQMEITSISMARTAALQAILHATG